MSWEYSIRMAGRADLEALVEFTLQGAREAEGVEIDPDGVRRGVASGLENPALATYWVAESQDGEVVAATSVVREWSDFYGGYYWWIQSLFIVSQHRGRGLVEFITKTLEEAAREAGALDLRLYAHNSNLRALGAYRRCGFKVAPYSIMIRRLTGH